MVSGATEQFRALWSKVPAALKRQYGPGFAASHEHTLNTTNSCSGRPGRVVQRMVDLVMRDGSLPTRELVGSDPMACASTPPRAAPQAARCEGFQAYPVPLRRAAPAPCSHSRAPRAAGPRSGRLRARVLAASHPGAADPEAEPPGPGMDQGKRHRLTGCWCIAPRAARDSWLGRRGAAGGGRNAVGLPTARTPHSAPGPSSAPRQGRSPSPVRVWRRPFGAGHPLGLGGSRRQPASSWIPTLLT